jgi:hypothetical protein
MHGYMTPCPEGCGSAKTAPPIPGLPALSELTLDLIDAHVRSLGLRAKISWRGGEWTVTLASPAPFFYVVIDGNVIAHQVDGQVVAERDPVALVAPLKQSPRSRPYRST